MKRKEYISPALKVRTLHLHHLICDSGQTQIDGTAADPNTTIVEEEGGGNILSKRSGFHWGPIDEGEN